MSKTKHTVMKYSDWGITAIPWLKENILLDYYTHIVNTE